MPAAVILWTMAISDRNSESSGASHTKYQAQHEHDELNRADEQPKRNRQISISAAERERLRANAKLANPLARFSHAELEDMGEKYAMKHQMGDREDIRAFQKGAILAQDPMKYKSVQGLRPDELVVLEKEFTHKWSQPKLMYIVIVLCSTCAAVQGMGMYTEIEPDVSPTHVQQMRRLSMAVNCFIGPNSVSTATIRDQRG